MTTMMREKFAALPDAQDLDVETLNHGPERAAIHHCISDANVPTAPNTWPPAGHRGI